MQIPHIGDTVWLSLFLYFFEQLNPFYILNVSLFFVIIIERVTSHYFKQIVPVLSPHAVELCTGMIVYQQIQLQTKSYSRFSLVSLATARGS